MSEKRAVTTFRVYLCSGAQALEGPVVSPDQTDVAENLPDLHRMLTQHGALLIYCGKWTYLPHHAILRIERGGSLFHLPWPLQ